MSHSGSQQGAGGQDGGPNGHGQGVPMMDAAMLQATMQHQYAQMHHIDQLQAQINQTQTQLLPEQLAALSAQMGQTGQFGGYAGMPQMMPGVDAGQASGLSAYQVTARGGRRLHVGHRRNPSEATPLATMLQSMQTDPNQNATAQAQLEVMSNNRSNSLTPAQMQAAQLQMMQLAQMQNFGGGMMVPGLQPAMQQSFPQQAQQPQAGRGHQRNMSAMPAFGGGQNQGGATMGSFDYFGGGSANRENMAGGNRPQQAGLGHTRRGSLDVSTAISKAAARNGKTVDAQNLPAPQQNFQFPSRGTGAPVPSDNLLSVPGAASRGGRGGHGRSQSMATPRADGGFNSAGASTGSFGHTGTPSRRGGHARSNSRSSDNWRAPNANPQQQIPEMQQPMPQQSGFQPGHRNRTAGSQSVSHINTGNYAPMGGLPGMIPNAMPGIPMQMGGLGMPGFPMNGQQMMPQMQVGQQQQGKQPNGAPVRKPLFLPYTAQGLVPSAVSSGLLVMGVLRVNKKNRSDAYVRTFDNYLEGDVYICGSKDRNRALEGDLVAVELLDVATIIDQKREKEDKKRRKDNGPDSVEANNLRRRGSLRERPAQKRNDDVEVEGQSLLLAEEEEFTDDAPPMFGGHVCAIVDRVPGQTFSGTLMLQRPNSMASREPKRENGREDGEADASEDHRKKRDERPKIVWFKPTDKRVPLIAIPTDQAPSTFVEQHASFADTLFVVCIKRWPITSLHPFGSLTETLGPMTKPGVQTEALLRDNNFPSAAFTEAATRNAAFEDWKIEDVSDLDSRIDFRGKPTIAVSTPAKNAQGAEINHAFTLERPDDEHIVLSIHVPDLTHFIAVNSVLDREAKKRCTAVYLLDRVSVMLPPRLGDDLCAMLPQQDRLGISVSFTVDAKTYDIVKVKMGRSVLRADAVIPLRDLDGTPQKAGSESPVVSAADLEVLAAIADRSHRSRVGVDDNVKSLAPLRLMHLLDDFNVPVQSNIFRSSRATSVWEELMHRVNIEVANKTAAGLPATALLRAQEMPDAKSLERLNARLARVGIHFDLSKPGSILHELHKIANSSVRRGVETMLYKTLPFARYYVQNNLAQERRRHSTLNVPYYTHFANPVRHYVDLMVQRQLLHVLDDLPAPVVSEESDAQLEALSRIAESCNHKIESAIAAQEQSVHAAVCESLKKRGQDVVMEGIVLNIYESAYDVLIDSLGIEKRVHCDQLPLKKAEFHRNETLELYWEKGVPSATYVPAPDESRRAAAPAPTRAPQDPTAHEPVTATQDADAANALFDNDDSEEESEPRLAPPAPAFATPTGNTPERAASSPPSYRPAGSNTTTTTEPEVRRAMSKLNPFEYSDRTGNTSYLPPASSHGDPDLSDLSMVSECLTDDGSCIQYIRTLQRVRVIVRTDTTKSPPCVSIRAVNPFAP